MGEKDTRVPSAAEPKNRENSEKNEKNAKPDPGRQRSPETTNPFLAAPPCHVSLKKPIARKKKRRQVRRLTWPKPAPAPSSAMHWRVPEVNPLYL